MSRLPEFHTRLAVPVIGAPMFLVSGPELVIAQCRAGVVGSFPSLNARPSGVFEQWLLHLGEMLTDRDAPFAVNLSVHRSNDRLDKDLALCVKYRVPIVITSLGAREDVNRTIHDYGGFVFHDVIHNAYARKAVAKGADGLVAVANGAGGHAGTTSPFALVQEIRRWFDGPLALSGAITSGKALVAARALGADYGYVGSGFIATEEADAAPAYKQMILDSGAADIIYTDAFSGIKGNYLAPSIRAAGLDPDNLADRSANTLAEAHAEGRIRAWRDIWGCGHGIGTLDTVVAVADFVGRLQAEYHVAIRELADDVGAMRLPNEPISC